MTRSHFGNQNIIMNRSDIGELRERGRERERGSERVCVPTSLSCPPNGTHFMSAVVTIYIRSSLDIKTPSHDLHTRLLTSRVLVCLLARRALRSLRVSCALHLEPELQQVLGVLRRWCGELRPFLHCTPTGREGGRKREEEGMVIMMVVAGKVTYEVAASRTFLGQLLEG